MVSGLLAQQALSDAESCWHTNTVRSSSCWIKFPVWVCLTLTGGVLDLFSSEEAQSQTRDSQQRSDLPDSSEKTCFPPDRLEKLNVCKAIIIVVKEAYVFLDCVLGLAVISCTLVALCPALRWSPHRMTFFIHLCSVHLCQSTSGWCGCCQSIMTERDSLWAADRCEHGDTQQREGSGQRDQARGVRFTAAALQGQNWACSLRAGKSPPCLFWSCSVYAHTLLSLKAESNILTFWGSLFIFVKLSEMKPVGQKETELETEWLWFDVTLRSGNEGSLEGKGWWWWLFIQCCTYMSLKLKKKKSFK